jgi:hypothetical protein
MLVAEAAQKATPVHPADPSSHHLDLLKIKTRESLNEHCRNPGYFSGIQE